MYVLFHQSKYVKEPTPVLRSEHPEPLDRVKAYADAHNCVAAPFKNKVRFVKHPGKYLSVQHATGV